LKAGDIDKLFELMESSNAEKKSFLSEEMKDFFEALALSFEKTGRLRLKGSFYKNEIVGMLFSFQMGNTVYAFNTGYNPYFFKLSPGVISFALDIKSAIDEGFTYYNFLRGEERYKFALGAEKMSTRRIKK
jgi:CelD/BcsL family acetyltransferase involved in cellulose biosynthesis